MSTYEDRRTAIRQNKDGFWRRTAATLSKKFGRPKSDPYEIVMLRSDYSKPQLIHAIEYHTDWAPFDIAQATERYPKNPASRSSIVVFRYHGPEKDRDHFTRDFRDVLKRVGQVRPLRICPTRVIE